MLLPSAALAGHLDLEWDAPTTNTDGTALTDLGAYRVYSATSGTPCPGAAYQQVTSTIPNPLPGTVVTYQLTGLTASTTYFVQVTAVDTSGSESACSMQVSAAALADAADTTAPAATLVSPAGEGIGATPIYTWQAVPGASWYELWVNDSAQSKKLDQWYTTAGVGCPAGTGLCSVAPSVPLAPGAATWWIRSWSPAGYGPWSLGLSFTVGGPAVVTLVSPAGGGIGATPIYTWNAVPGATWYELWVNDSAQGKKLDQWYTAAAVGCPAGTGLCSVGPSVPLAPGAATWWIQWWGPSGSASWSAGMAFIVSGPSTMATLLSPSGSGSPPTPTYSWSPVSGMSWYYLWVVDSTGPKVQVWLQAATAGCGSGTGTCRYTPSAALAPGAVTWWIEGWSPAGYGPWSLGLSFTVSP